ncbi:hypothetical protein EI94DRAFT_1733438 [Lactarius quietus]|nr:hypothetical protein EI94DRAFT_1733438 [Lactarius quietus]
MLTFPSMPGLFLSYPSPSSCTTAKVASTLIPRSPVLPAAAGKLCTPRSCTATTERHPHCGSTTTSQVPHILPLSASPRCRCVAPRFFHLRVGRAEVCCGHNGIHVCVKHRGECVTNRAENDVFRLSMLVELE